MTKRELAKKFNRINGEIIKGCLEIAPECNEKQRLELIKILEGVRDNIDIVDSKPTTYSQLIPRLWD